MWKRTNTTQGKARTYWTQSETKQNKTLNNTQATMTNMNVCVCETCYFHLVEYLGNINKTWESTTKTTTKQQEQIKRENIYFREQRTNQCQQNKQKKKKRSAVLPARATTWRTRQKRNTEKQICSVGFIRKQIHANKHTQTHQHSENIMKFWTKWRKED